MAKIRKRHKGKKYARRKRKRARRRSIRLRVVHISRRHKARRRRRVSGLPRKLSRGATPRGTRLRHGYKLVKRKRKKSRGGGGGGIGDLAISAAVIAACAL